MTRSNGKNRVSHGRVFFPLAVTLLAALCAVPAEARPPDNPCEPWVEMQGNTARLRPHLDAFVSCRIDEAVYAVLVSEAVCPEATPVQPASIALGRIEDMPWLAQALVDAALADPAWNAKRGKTRGENLNALVSRLLMSDALRTRLAAPLAGSGLAITGISVEKVLVRRVVEHGRKRAPVDAQVWLTLGDAGPVSAGTKTGQ